MDDIESLKLMLKQYEPQRLFIEMLRANIDFCTLSQYLDIFKDEDYENLETFLTFIAEINENPLVLKELMEQAYLNKAPKADQSNIVEILQDKNYIDETGIMFDQIVKDIDRSGVDEAVIEKLVKFSKTDIEATMDALKFVIISQPVEIRKQTVLCALSDLSGYGAAQIRLFNSMKEVGEELIFEK